MASIWFKPENTTGFLESPVFHTDDNSGFYSTRNLYFYARIYLDSNEMSGVQTLLTVLGDHGSDFSSYRMSVKPCTLSAGMQARLA